MRDRHFPRLCGSCHAPMARQEDSCWRCGTQWAGEEQPATMVRFPVRPMQRVASAAGAGGVDVDIDRWANEGGPGDVRVGAVLAQSAGGRQ